MESQSGYGFERVRTQRVFEGVCNQIRMQLADGRLKPGDKLPAERHLAVEFGVGRQAVREALRTMEISGVIELRKGVKGGAFVKEGSPAMLTKSLQDLVVLGQISKRSLAEARMLIHGLVVRLACERGKKADFDAIEQNIQQIEDFANAGDLARRAEAAVDFFRLITKATKNDVLVVLVDSLGEILRHMVLEQQPLRYRPELIPVRWEILEHLRARNADKAAASMEYYLSIVHRSVLRK